MIEVGAAVVRDGRGRVLIACRQANEGGLWTELAGLWEFPGGKREPGENFEMCVARELMDLRRQLGVMSSRQFVTKRLDAMEERLLEAIGSATAPIPVEGVAEDDHAHRDHGGGQHSSQASNRHHERP